MARSKQQYERSVAIAKDYYFTGMSVAEIGEKYSCSGNNVCSIAKRFSVYDLMPPKEQQPMDALLFDPEYTTAAIELLNEFNVKFHAPKSYTAEIEIESSLNY